MDCEYDYGRDEKQNLDEFLVLFVVWGFFSLFLSKENPILFSDSYSIPASYCVKILEYW